VTAEKSDYEGFLTRPMSWQRAKDKYDRLVEGRLEPRLALKLSETVAALDDAQTADLTALLARAGAQTGAAGAQTGAQTTEGGPG
jgi:2-methylcitrate dehydratase